MLSKYTKGMSKSYECKLSELNFPKHTALFVWWKTVLLSLHIWRHKQPIFLRQKVFGERGKNDKNMQNIHTQKQNKQTNKKKNFCKNLWIGTQASTENHF